MRASLILLAAPVLLSACGSTAPPARATTPFTAEHAEVFEDGVDFIADPTHLEGAWREDWSRDLDQRVSESDLIARITVHTLRTDTDLERINTYRLQAKIDEALWGEPPEDEVTLTVREGEAGFGTLEGNDRRILNQPFLAFIKWYDAPDGQVRPHWHLAPATEPVVSRVEYLIENRLRAPEDRAERRVTVHED
jgi:hypothetical protein